MNRRARTSLSDIRYRSGILISALLISGTALADDATLARCRAITDAKARLACYDALPVPSPEAQPAAAAPQAGAPQAAAPAAPARTPTEQFGLEERVPPSDLLGEINSRIDGKFEGWWPNAIIRLANGQAWQVSDGSSRIYDVDSPKVTISRGLLGAFYLNLDGDNRTVRVRRVQ